MGLSVTGSRMTIAVVPMGPWLTVGQYNVFFKEPGSADGYLDVLGLEVAVILLPQYSYQVAIPSKANLISVGQGAVPGDLVVLQESDRGCSGAAEAITGLSAQGATVLDSRLQFKTSIHLSKPGLYKVCILTSS